MSICKPGEHGWVYDDDDPYVDLEDLDRGIIKIVKHCGSWGCFGTSISTYEVKPLESYVREHAEVYAESDWTAFDENGN